MHLQAEHNVGRGARQSSFIIAEASAVGGADFYEFRSRLLHDFRHAKAAAYFHQFAPPHRHATPGCQSSQHQHHGCRAVVHDDGSFGIAELGEESPHSLLARASFACLQVEFNV